MAVAKVLSLHSSRPGQVQGLLSHGIGNEQASLFMVFAVKTLTQSTERVFFAEPSMARVQSSKAETLHDAETSFPNVYFPRVLFSWKKDDANT